MSSISTSISATPADVPIRIGARMIDALLLGVVGVAFGKLIGFGFDWLTATAAIVILYFVLMDVVFGGTAGKLVLGLHVIGPQGGGPTMRQALTREAFMLAGAVPFVGPLLAVGAWIWIIVTIRSSPLRQGMHDMLAGGTRVVSSKTGS